MNYGAAQTDRRTHGAHERRSGQIEVNGVAVRARKGEMIIQATDAVDAYVPRFCYHDKLAVAANCRMCLVEVEKAPKPLPACATPVAEGMKIFTKSPKAIAAQRATMEFLLINHPLDCPICDQGGECELQDLAMGFGRDVSRFNERKRVVKDKNIGPLVSTDMTRCIHCTRCVRFTSEIAGLQELGATGRGENMEIGTFIEKSVDHELSGNIIDLCPVGALNSKPFRYQGRSWEMVQVPLVSPHDPFGTNLYGHVRRGHLMRIVGRDNEAINETWIADRDRYSYEGIYASDRLMEPMVRIDGELKATDWQTALSAAADGLKGTIEAHGVSRVGFLSAPTATTEEQYLLQKLARGLGVANIDHRLRQQDFRDQDADPLFPSLGLSIASIESLRGALVVGSHLRHEVPLLAHRLRKAVVRGAAEVAFLNPSPFPVRFPIAAEINAGMAHLADELGSIAIAAAELAGAPPPNLSAKPVTEAHRLIARLLHAQGQRLVLIGALAHRHADFARIRRAAAAVAALSGAALGYLSDGGNAAGAALAGCLPHRGVGGAKVTAGRDAAAMLREGLKSIVLFGGVEAEEDTAIGGASLKRAEFVLALTPYLPASLAEVAHVVLPIGTFAETSGTFVNIEGRWQSFAGAARAVGESRPGWKVLRVLGNLTNVAGFDFESSEEVLEELKGALGGLAAAAPDTAYLGSFRAEAAAAGAALDVPMYRSDAIVRRAPALQATRIGHAPVESY